MEIGITNVLTIGGIDDYDMINNPGDKTASITIWFSGCTFKCKGCHNEELQSITEGTKSFMTGMELVKYIMKRARKTNIDSVVLLGGEPLQQNKEELLFLCHSLSINNIKIWLYTGYEFNEVPNDILDMIDVVKTGKYIEELKCIGFPSSTNQKIYKKVSSKWQIQN